MLEATRPSFGYMKPFGDRPLHRKKRLWDYDAALVTDLFGLEEGAEDVSISHQHSKMRYTYDEDMTKGKLIEMVTRVGDGKDLVVVEAGRDMSHGVSVHLDALSVAKWTKGDLVVVASGDENAVLDDLAFLRRYVDTSDLSLRGVIVNKVPDVEGFRATYLERLAALDMPVLGVLPHTPELTHLSVSLLAEALYAKVVAGSSGLGGVVQNTFVGAMSAEAAVASPLWERPAKLIITSGDRTDMVAAAVDSDTRAVVLTNNITPPPQVVAKADERGVPLLLVAQDTFQTAQKVDGIEPLLTKDDAERVAVMGRLVERHVDVKALVGE